MDAIVDRLIQPVLNMSATQLLRLVAIIGGYMLLRGLATRELAKRQLAAQVREHEQSKKDKRAKELEPEQPDDISDIASSDFGWGNQTRAKVRRQQKMLERAVDRLKEDDDDSDIAHLLEE